jgi:acetyl-CoA synthetase
MAAKEDGIEISSLAPMFRNKVAEPYWVRYAYSIPAEPPDPPDDNNGQSLTSCSRVAQGAGRRDTESAARGRLHLLQQRNAHGMIAVEGSDACSLRVVLPGEGAANTAELHTSIVEARRAEDYVCNRFVKTQEDEHGALQTWTRGYRQL